MLILISDIHENIIYYSISIFYMIIWMEFLDISDFISRADVLENREHLTTELSCQ